MDSSAVSNLVGAAPAFLDCRNLVVRMAAGDVTVLIQGETGTGKELAARAMHYLGPRRDFPFVPVNCGAIPDDLVENEFFGHVRGAFTDARETQQGLVANAEGGTLFLDEIECLSPRGQVVLLRFLQDRVYRPLGSRHQKTGNVRVLAASNADLREMTAKGKFREDLLYRLSVILLTLPPLRDRPGDVLLLANHFLRRLATEYRQPEKVLDPDSTAALVNHSWPGNVRELENLIHRAFLLTEGNTIRIGELSPSTPPSPLAPRSPFLHLPLELGFRRAKALVVAEFERAFIARALAESQGNVSRAARLTGKERRAFGKLLKKHGISAELDPQTDPA